MGGVATPGGVRLLQPDEQLEVTPWSPVLHLAQLEGQNRKDFEVSGKLEEQWSGCNGT